MVCVCVYKRIIRGVKINEQEMEYWNGVLELSIGMEYWNGVLRWSIGMRPTYTAGKFVNCSILWQIGLFIWVLLRTHTHTHKIDHMIVRDGQTGGRGERKLREHHTASYPGVLDVIFQCFHVLEQSEDMIQWTILMMCTCKSCDVCVTISHWTYQVLKLLEEMRESIKRP